MLITSFLKDMLAYFSQFNISNQLVNPVFNLESNGNHGKGHGKKAHTRSGAAAIKRQAKKIRNKKGNK